MKSFFFFLSGLGRPELWGIEKEGRSRGWGCCCCCSVAKSCWTLCDPWTEERQASLSFSVSMSWLKLMSIELVMNENHLIQPSHPLLPASPPEGRLGRAIWQLGWRDCTPPAGNPPALLVWQEGADCNSLGLPNDLGTELEGADKGSPSREMMVLPAPLPRNLSEKLSWWMFHRWLNRMCTLLLLSETFHKSQSY